MIRPARPTLAEVQLADLFLALPREVAEALARCEYNLCLDGVTTLTPEVAETLARHKGGVLSLRGLTTLSDKAAETLRANKDIVLPDQFR
jgi:hypothetical protein